MGEAKQRQIVAETVAWRKVRDAGLTGLAVGLRTGDFSGAPRDPLAESEAATPGFPPTAGIQRDYLAMISGNDTVTLSTYLTGLELQDALLESARRTAVVGRGSRAAALARVQAMLEDAPNRSDHLDDLLLADDLPIGPASNSPSTGAIVI